MQNIQRLERWIEKYWGFHIDEDIEKSFANRQDKINYVKARQKEILQTIIKEAKDGAYD